MAWIPVTNTAAFSLVECSWVVPAAQGVRLWL